MPILNLEIIGNQKDFPYDLAQKIADAAGHALDSRPQGTWVKLSFIPPQQYAENGGVEDGMNPIIVSLIQSEVPPANHLGEQITKLTNAISSASGVPSQNVHIVIEPGAKGRIAFGGNLVE